MKQEWSKTEARLKQDSSKTEARLKQDSSKTQARLKQDSSKAQARLKQDSKQGNKNIEKPLRFSSNLLKKSDFWRESWCENTKNKKKLKNHYDLCEILSDRVIFNENPCVKTQKGSLGTLGKLFSRRPTGTN